MAFYSPLVLSKELPLGTFLATISASAGCSASAQVYESVSFVGSWVDSPIDQARLSGRLLLLVAARQQGRPTPKKAADYY